MAQLVTIDSNMTVNLDHVITVEGNGPDRTVIVCVDMLKINVPLPLVEVLNRIAKGLHPRVVLSEGSLNDKTNEEVSTNNEGH